MKIAQGSFCASRGTVVSIIDELRNNGMAQSIAVYEIYLGTGECANLPPVEFKVGELVAYFGNAVAVEALLSNGNTVYYLAALAKYVPIGGETPLQGDPA